MYPWCDQLCGFLCQAGEERVNRTDEQVGAVAARYAGKRGGKTCKGVSAHRHEHHGTQRHEHHVAELRCRVRDDSREDNGRGDQYARIHEARVRRPEDDSPNACLNEPASFRHSHTQQGHQHRTERSEVRKVRHQVLNDSPNALCVHQTDGVDAAIGRTARRSVRPGIRYRHVEELCDPTYEDDASGEEREQRYRMRKQVAEPLDEPQEAPEPSFLVISGSRSGCGTYWSDSDCSGFMS
jgi:hypothetical protein